MSLLNIPAYECDNESDVEQKFLYPLLTHPSFLAIPPKAIASKKYLSTLPFVSKSTLPRNYIPDYILFVTGFPVCVIEAKQPEVSAETAIQEARLYPCCHAALVERARRRREGAQGLRLLSGLIGASLGAKNLGSPMG